MTEIPRGKKTLIILRKRVYRVVNYTCKLCGGPMVVRWRLDGGVLPLFDVPQVQPESLVPSGTVITHRTNRRKRAGRDDHGHYTQRLRVVMATLTAETRGGDKNRKKIANCMYSRSGVTISRSSLRGRSRLADRKIYIMI